MPTSGIPSVIRNILAFFSLILWIIALALQGGLDAIRYVLDSPSSYTAGDSIIPKNDSHDQKIKVLSVKDKFDVNDVVLEISYGTHFIGEKEKHEENKEYTAFMIYVTDERFAHYFDTITEQALDESNDNLILYIPPEKAFNDEYGYDLNKKLLSDEIEYNNVSTIKIPRDIFKEQAGTLSVIFNSYSYVGENSPYAPEILYAYSGKGNLINISYRMIDENTVDLQFENERFFFN